MVSVFLFLMVVTEINIIRFTSYTLNCRGVTQSACEVGYIKSLIKATQACGDADIRMLLIFIIVLLHNSTDNRYALIINLNYNY